MSKGNSQLVVVIDACEIFRRGDFAAVVNPIVTVSVDGSRAVQTKARKNDYHPTFSNEPCAFSNVNSSSVVEVRVLSQICHDGGTREHKSSLGVVGTCLVSLCRIPPSGERSQWYALATEASNASDAAPGSPTNSDVTAPPAISGFVKVTLRADKSLVSPHLDRLNVEAESAFMRRLHRFLSVYDSRHLNAISTIVGDAVDWSEVSSPNDSNSQPTIAEGRTTFDEVLQHFIDTYGSEPSANSFKISVLGANHLVKPIDHPAIAPFIVASHGAEQFETPPALGEDSPSFASEWTFDVVGSPESAVIDILVLNNSRFRDTAEIGRARISLATLARGEKNYRTVPVTRSVASGSDDSKTLLTGHIHVCLLPNDFGFVDAAESKFCEEFYNRLSRLFERYDMRRLPNVDELIQAHVHHLEELMSSLVQMYGREPGSSVLKVAVQQIRWLAVTQGQMLDAHVVVKVTMGGVVLLSKPVRYQTFCITEIEEEFSVDVSRETDVLTIEIVSAAAHSGEDDTATVTSTSYGRVDLTIVAIQRSVPHSRTYTLVANAGKEYAKCCGQIVVQLLSNEVGKETFVDDEYEQFHANRLRRFCAKYLREKLHRVDIAVATTSDLERFVTDLAGDFGAEPVAHQLTIRVLGAKNLPNRMGGLNPCVSVNCGMQLFMTAPQKSTSPSYGDTFTFDVESSTEGGSDITFTVIDVAEHGGTRSVVGQVHFKASELTAAVDTTHWFEIKGRIGSGTLGVQFLLAPLPKYPINHDGARSAVSRPVIDASAPSPSVATSEHRRTAQSSTSPTASAAVYRSATPPRPQSAGRGRRSPKRASTPGRSTTPAKPLDIPTLQQQQSSTPTIARMRQAFPSPTQDRTHADCQHELLPPAALRLQVKIYRCERLNMPSCSHLPPQMNPYVTVTTDLSKFRTSDAPVATYDPDYDNSFDVRLRDVEADAIRLSVQTITQDGSGGKKVAAIIGKAILSAKGLRRGVEKVLWVDLVHAAGKPQAYYRGKVKVGLTAFTDFPPIDKISDAEMALLRVQARNFLIERAPQELHKLEYFLGEFAAVPDRLLPKLHELFEPAQPRLQVSNIPPLTASSSSTLIAAESDYHLIKVSVVAAQLLWSQIRPETALVKIKSSLEKFTTASHPAGRKLIELDEYFQCRVEASGATAHAAVLEFTLVGRNDAGKELLVAAAHVSTAGLARGFSHDRHVLLVVSPGTKAAKVIGSLSLSLETTASQGGGGGSTQAMLPLVTGSPKAQREALERTRREVQRFLDRTRPQDLHRIDVILWDPASIADLDSGIKRIVLSSPSSLQPQAQEVKVFSLDVAVGAVRQLPRTDSTRGGCTPYVILAVGTHQHVTRTLKASTCAASFGESFSFELTAPAVNVLTVIVMDVGAACDTESGRVVIPLSHLSLGVMRATVHNLTLEAMTSRARLHGDISLQLTARDFGGSVAMVTPLKRSEIVAAVEDALLRSGRPDLLHRAECIAANSGFVQSVALAEVAALPPVLASSSSQDKAKKTSGASQRHGAGESSSHVLIVGFKHFYNAPCGKLCTPASCCVKLYIDGASVGKTSALKLAGIDTTWQRGDGGDAAVSSCKINTPLLKPSDVLTFKIIVPRMLLGHDVLAYVDMTVQGIAAGGETTRWLPFFNEASGDRLGYLGVCVQLDPATVLFAAGNMTSSVAGSLIESTTTVARVMEDVASLLRKYNKFSLLRNLAVHVEQRSLETVHRQLRQSLAPMSICSIDFTIHAVALLGSKCQSGNSTISIRVTCNSDKGSTPPFDVSNSSALTDCSARLDITRIDDLTPLLFELVRDGIVIVATARFPLRALVTSGLFRAGDIIALPLVAVELTSGSGGGTVGTKSRPSPSSSSVQAELRFSARLPLFEDVPPTLPYPERTAALFDHDFIMYYYNKMRRYLSMFEPQSLIDFSVRFFDVDVAKSPWAEVLPARMDRLINAYGHEVLPMMADAGMLSPPKVSEVTKRALLDQFSSGSVLTPMSSRKSARTSSR